MEKPFPAYSGDKPYVFVCYSHTDEDQVYAEIRWLQHQGINVWYDTTGIGPGSEWNDEIAKAIKGANQFLYFLTPNSVGSEHCRRELNFAQSENRKIAVVHLEETDLPDGLRLSLDNRQAILRYRLSSQEYRNGLIQSLDNTQAAPTPRAPSSQPLHDTNRHRQTIIKIGAWSLDVETGTLQYRNVLRHLPPRNASVLQYLAEHAGTTISIDRLLNELWPNPYSSDAAVQKVISELRTALDDSLKDPRYIQTLPKRGYRLIATVDLSTGAPVGAATPASDTDQTGRKPRSSRARRMLWISIAVLVVGFSGGGLFWTQRVSEPPPSIAVLPFENLSPNPDDAYFAAGIYEETLIQLAKIDDLGLIGPTTMARYATNGKSISELGSELGVSAVMEGTVRYANDRVRLTVHLTDTGTGRHLWSQAYERSPQDIFAVQLDIATNITESLEAEFKLDDRQSVAAIKTTNLDAYSAYVKGLALIRMFPPRLPEALSSLQAAVEADPEFADALGALAMVHVSFVTVDFMPDASRESEIQHVETAATLAERALSINPNQGNAHLALSRTAFLKRRFDEALDHAKVAYEVAPNSATAVYGYARMLGILGNVDAAIPLFDRAMALDPMNPNYPVIGSATMARSERFKEARRYHAKLMELAPDSYVSHFGAAWIEAWSGNLDKAGPLIDEARTRMPTQISANELLNFLQVYTLLDRRRETNELFQRVLSFEDLNDGHLFRAYRIRGETDTALDYLHSMIDAGYPASNLSMLSLSRHRSVFDSIRHDPRFVEAFEKLDSIDKAEYD